MRKIWFMGLVVLLVVLAACGSRQPAVEKFTLPLGYVANVQFSPFYMTVERGYFREAGYEVTFDYRWETDGMQLVAAGQIPFTVASGDQVIQARSKGLPVVAVASWFRKFPVAVITLADRPLNSPADLRGLRIGTPVTFGASYIGLRALLKAGGLTEADVDIQEVGFAQLAALTAGKVDAVVVYANNEPVVLAQQGTPYNILYVSDYAQLVSNSIVTNETMIQEHPERVRAFVRAFVHGLGDVLADPEAAFEVSRRYVPELDANAALQKPVLQATLEFWRAERLGWFDPAAWETSQQVMLEAGLIDKVTPVEAMYTNQFVP